MVSFMQSGFTIFYLFAIFCKLQCCHWELHMIEEVADNVVSTTKQDDLIKLKLVLSEPIDSPLNRFQKNLRDRGVKNIDLNQIVSEALSQVPEAWWDQRLDEVTPIEFKLQQAMEDPEMREKIISLLSGSSPRDIKGARIKK